jgi:UDP-2-acetamido-3-amino-2,3-dideoxy-glucuronate N-acetyltransferase
MIGAMTRDPTTRVAPDVLLGHDVRLAPFTNLYGCRIGDESRIGPFVEIQKGASVGRRVKIQSHSFVCEGVHIEDEVFIGHGVMFINDRRPRATRDDGALQGDGDWVCETTHVERRASIGSNATILCGVRIGAEAMIGAGSVVTADVPPRAVVAGNPARVMRYLDDR